MLRSRSIHYFAARTDLEAIFAIVEAKRPLQYVRAGMFDTPESVILSSGLQIPHLGLAPSGINVAEPFWLVTNANVNVQIKSVPQRRGGIRYGIDPGLNPESVVLWAGGVFENSAVIAGRIGTGVINPVSMELLNLFVRPIRRQFERIKSFYVGPEAERLFNAGYRLTTSVRSPKFGDLSRD